MAIGRCVLYLQYKHSREHDGYDNSPKNEDSFTMYSSQGYFSFLK